MKLLFWRRKPKQDTALAAPIANDTSMAVAVEVAAPRGAVPTARRVDRSQVPTQPLAMPPEVRDAALRFALDVLKASGARLRVEAEDVISATLLEGTSVRYTTTLAVARDDEETHLLVQGGAALADLVERCAHAGALGALALTDRVDPVGTARTSLVAPPAGCERCTTPVGRGDLDACDQCPLRERTGRIVLRGLGRLDGVSVARMWDGWSVEMAYEIAYSDRQGRRTEWVRLAFDASSLEPRTILDSAALRSALPTAIAPELASCIGDIERRAEQALAPQLTAGAAFLRLRSERDFRDRAADLQSTADRLATETPADEPHIASSLAAELERLCEVFAVDVEARLSSVCLVRSPMAEVRLQRPHGDALTLTVDIGRGEALPPTCIQCGATLCAGTVCERGHITCSACARASGEADSCTVCAKHDGDVVHAPRRAKRKNPAKTSNGDTGPDAPLAIAHVRDMSHETWREFAGWLAERDGIRLERAEDYGAVVLWRGRAADTDGHIILAALRPSAPLRLSGEDVRTVAAAGAALPGARLHLLSTALASDEARSEARRLNVDLRDGELLARQLEEMGTVQVTARQAERKASAARAATAKRTREAVLAHIAALEETLASAANGRRASGRAAVSAAAEAAETTRQEALRAFLAWDTLTGEWVASFDERAGREGTLVMLADEARFAEMAERAAHLRTVTTAALKRIAATPGAGDLGYGVWRRSMVEELTARCESCRWRLLALDPARWDDFTAAHDTTALERATAADASAHHAATRVTKAYGEMAQRARL